MADALQTSAVLKSKAQLGDEIEIVFSPGLAARDPERYLDYALGLPGRIAEADGKQVVVFFDEFQEIGEPASALRRPRPADQADAGDLPAHHGRQLPVRRQPRAPDARPLHPVAPRASPVRRLPRPAPDRRRGVGGGLNERFAADDCTVEPAALERIIEYGEGQPRSTMLIAQKSHLTTVELEHPPGRPRPSSNRACSARWPPTASPTSRSSSGSAALTSSAWSSPSVSRAASPSTPGLSAGRVRRALETLRDAGIIDSAGRADWRFSNPLLRRYLQAIAPFE